MSTTTSPRPAAPPGEAAHGNAKMRAVVLVALGVVYGDIGTSPLYALRECFGGEHGVAVLQDNVLGALSLIFWALLLIITVKYLLYVMRADNHGEGGILALMVVARPEHDQPGRRGGRWIVVLGLFGAALLYGDAMITPAISVLSAMEGLEVATPAFTPYVIPLTLVILAALFAVQSRGTAKIGSVFGPITLLWFLCLGALGLRGILLDPSVLRAVDPTHAVTFFLRNGWQGFLMLGAVFLVITGGEALYADMGHFGRRPIRIAWLLIVLPGLLLNYFGQGALLITDPSGADNPFYRLAPTWALYPLVVLAACATVIASQAVISGTFSLTRQAVNLGYAPRMRILHTSADEVGQVYVPMMNWLLLFATCALVLGFQRSSALAGAYGVAVTTTMVITTLLAFVVAVRRWRWNLGLVLAFSLVFLAADLAFFGANLVKIADGGWFPLAVGGMVYLVMATWKRGREILRNRLRERTLPFDGLLKRLAAGAVRRVPGTAVFLTSSPRGVPPALAHNLEHNSILHERVVIASVVVEEVPFVPIPDRVKVQEIGHGLWSLIIRYGFKENPDVPLALALCPAQGLCIDVGTVSFFLGHEILLATDRPGMAIWRERLFSRISRNALRATAFYGLPPERVVELGAQIEL